MVKNGNYSSQSQFTDHEVEIIDEITITLAMILGNYIRDYKNPQKTMNMYSKVSSSEKNLARVFMSLSLRNMSHQEGVYPDQIKEDLTNVSKALFKESRGVFLDSRSRLSKLLKEFETAGIILSIEGKKRIKKESSKSHPGRPKGGLERRKGYPIVYKLTSAVEDYKKILCNPQALYLINKKLLKHGNLEKAYDLISKNAFYALKKGDEKMYNFLQPFAVLFPNVDTNTIPEPGLFREAFNSAGEEVLEKLRKDFVQYLLENPSSSLFFIFNLAKARC